MKDAIQLAIDGGYDRGGLADGYKRHYTGTHVFWKNAPQNGHSETSTSRSYESFLLDPLFWQALVKGLGTDVRDKETDHVIKLSGGVGITPMMTEWARQMRRFTDRLIEGKDAESFFNELLK